MVLGRDIIGIDLGTTNSAVAVMENGSPKITALGGAKRTMPSVVAFTDEGEPLVGKPAEDQAIQNPGDTVESIKRHIGEDERVIEEFSWILESALIGSNRRALGARCS